MRNDPTTMPKKKKLVKKENPFKEVVRIQKFEPVKGPGSIHYKSNPGSIHYKGQGE